MKDIYSLSAFLAHCATVVGVPFALWGAYLALKTYRSNNSIRKWKLIKEIFDNFMKDDLYKFYEKIKNGDQIDFEGKPDDEMRLNKALTLFDALSYFQTEGLLGKRGKEDEKAWEYFACEILNYVLNNSVWKYIKRTEKKYKDIGFDEYIIPFSGFPDLYENLPERFRPKCPRQLINQFNKLSQEERKFYHDKVEDIPDDTKLLKQLKHTAAIILFGKDKGWTTPED
ncbi:MAG: hypothetical protein WA228_01110 [Desulfobaccales bacterium]